MLNDYEGAVSRDEPVFLDADDLTDIAEYYQQNARYDEADRAISRAIEMEPHALSVLNYQVHQALAEGNVEEAEDFLDQMMERESPEYIYSRAEVMIAKGETDAADRFLRDCLHDVPSDEYQDYVLDVANIYTDYGLSDKAMEWMMRARYDNTDDFKELMARTLFGLGKYEDSERLFNELIDHDPFQKRYWNALASTQFMKEDYSASVTSSEYAIAIDPDDPDAVVSKANGLYRLENYEQALTYFERYSRLVPDDEFGFLHQGSCLINLGRFEDAVRQLNTAEQLAPDDSPYLLEIYEEQAEALEEAGVDLFVLETMMTVPEARAAVLAVKKASDRPVFVTFTCDAAGRTLGGTDVTAALLIMQGMGVDAFGLNCSVGPEDVLAQIRRMQQIASIPLIAKPNAGMPQVEDGKVVYHCPPEAFTAVT
jgi:tetratricopeptide (TPR) repeat protein